MPKTIRVYCAGAVKSVLSQFIEELEQKGDLKLACTYGPVGELLNRIAQNEAADLAILNRQALEELVKLGRVESGSVRDLGSVGIGIAVGASAPSPDVTTPSSLRGCLLAASSVAYGDPQKGDSSGIHFQSVLRELGIEERIREKTTLAPLGLAVADLVAAGQVEIGATQASVILSRPGVKLAGLLPESLQHTTTYSIGVISGASAPDARRCTSWLVSERGVERFRALGFR